MTRLIEQLTRLPGIGEKTAARLAFYILRADQQYAQALAEAVLAVKNETRLCSVCFALTEADPCPICTDPTRLPDAICVVEEPADLLAVERAREFRGQYHVLHGTLAPLDGVGPDELKIQPLLVRLRASVVREVILATNPTAEGEATALYLARLIKPLGIRVTRIAHGIPVGGERGRGRWPAGSGGSGAAKRARAREQRTRPQMLETRRRFAHPGRFRL